MITSHCGECTNDLIKEQRGCEQPTQMPVWVIDEYSFFICPLSFISPQIKSWYNKYNQIKKGICQKLNFNSTNPKFFEAIDFYTYYLDKCKQDKIDINEQSKNIRILKEAKQWQNP